MKEIDDKITSKIIADAILVKRKKRAKEKEKDKNKPKTLKEFIARGLDKRDVFEPEGAKGWSCSS